MDDGSLPEDRWYLPLDLLTVASAAERMGCAVKILDGGLLGLDEISNLIGRDVEVVGLSYSAMSIRNLEKLAKLAYSRGIRVILGGQAATASAHSLAQEPFIDLVVVGDGEPAIKEIVKQISRCEWNPNNIPNSLSYIDGRYVQGPSVEVSSSQIGRFSRFSGGVEPESYIGAFADGNTLKNISAIRATNIFSKRGCRGRCSFCARTDKHLRSRNPNEVVTEILELTNRFNLDYIIDHSDTWMSNTDWVRRFVEERSQLNNGMPKMMIFMDTRYANATAIDLLPQGGIDNVLLGIESASERILSKNGKHNSKQHILEVIQRLLANDIKVTASFVLGLIGEDDASLAETCKFIEQISQSSRVRCYCNVIMPLPGSPAWSLFMESKKGKKWLRTINYNLNDVRYDFIRLFTNISGGLDRLLQERDAILSANNLLPLEFAR